MAKDAVRSRPLKDLQHLAICMNRIIAEMTPRQRRRLREQVLRLDTSNCSWLIYAQKQPILNMIQMHTPNMWPFYQRKREANKRPTTTEGAK